MATLKLKPKPLSSRTEPRSERAPVRGQGSAPRQRPTLPQAQAQRSEREARYQEQLRQRFGDRTPPAFARRDEPAPEDASRRRAPPPQNTRPTTPASSRAEPRSERAPSRGQGSASRERSALPPAQAQRGEREARYQEQLRQRFGDRAPPVFARRDESAPDDSSRRRAPDAPRAHAKQSASTARGPRAAAREPRQREITHAEVPGSMRLSKRMSELGIASRREADEWIAKGWVRVDDQVVSELGSRVVPGQRVTVDAKAKFQQAQKVTVLINKPIGYVSGQAEDGYEPAVVLVTPQNLWRGDQSGTRFLRDHLRQLAPAGRLDIDSVGLLVLTQDGRIAKQLIGEDSEMEKEYLVRVQTLSGSALPDSSLALLRHGLELDGEALRPAQVEWVNDDQLRFVLKEGKKRQIRRMCEAVDLKVLGLKRVRIGGVMLGDLLPGQWRYLRADESFIPRPSPQPV